MTAAATPGASDMERQALAALRKMRERVDALESARHEPLAIVGAACRFPGAPDIDAFWDLLCRGGDAIVDIPPERWDKAALERVGAAAGARVPNKAGMLPRVDGFDAEFFGISAREAQLMDPQQRLFLEVAWEALERANIPPLGLKGSRCGVFVGTTTSDYLQLLHQRLSSAEHDAYIVSGNTINATAGRVSYTLGLQGPSMAIDTACSSSLVAIDRACRSLRDGESRLAIAGGVNMILTPELLLSLARWGMLSPDGHCKTFDATANGFVRAEGCGVVLIKRLADARADGDRIWALVRGWAVNQAGRSSAFGVPNGLAQAAVMREALAAAHVAPGGVAYVEAHGTGTSLGDPIEMESITEAYGAQRSVDAPLWVGAVKSNVGHLECAAGVTGFIKTVLALRHRQIPPNVNFLDPTPHIPWDSIPVRVPTRLEEFPAIAGRRLAGVSAFGFSGTNAHVVLEEAPPDTAGAASEALPALLLTVSARSPAALQELALAHARGLDGAVSAETLCLASGAARSHLAHRLAVSAPNAAELVLRLRLAARGESGAGVVQGRVGIDRPGVAFLFTGQGAQHAGMGRRLLRSSPVFRAAFERCAAVIDPLLDRPLLDLIDSADASLLNRTGYTQPALFAIEYALAEWWRSVGVEPAVVLGHSVGEFAAACCAGVLTLEDAATLVTLRGALMQALPAGGAMAAVFASEQTVRERMAGIAGVLAVAGINGPHETAVSGDAQAVQALSAAFAATGVRVEPLAVSHAFHSPRMQPMLARFEAATGRIVVSPARCPVISSMTGLAAAADWGSASYWLQQLQAPVRWFDALRSAAGSGIGAAIEIGPQPVLAALGRRALPDAAIAWLPSLRREHDDGATIMNTLAALYVQGAVDDWSGRAGAAARAQVDLPVYPFQHTRHWVDAPDRSPAAALAAWCHPLLGAALALATDDRIFETAAGDARHAWVREHRIGIASLWPAAASVEMLLAATREAGAGATLELRDIEFRAPLVLPKDGSVAVQTVLRPGAAGGWTAEICLAPEQSGGRWPAFVSARVLAPAEPALLPDLRAAQARCNEPVDAAAFHAALARAGAPFGEAFRRLTQVGRAPGEAIAQLIPHAASGDDGRWLIHPSQLDACLQLVSVADGEGDNAGQTLWLPTAIECLTVHGRANGSLWGHAQLHPASAAGMRLVADLSIWNLDGSPVASVQGVQFLRARADDIVGADTSLVGRCGMEFEWSRLAAMQAASADASRWQISAGGGVLGAELLQALKARGADALAADAPSPGAARHVVHLAALDLPDDIDADAMLLALRPVLESALRLVQSCAAAALPPRLWFVTRGAQAVHGGEPASPLAATLWGLARVLRAEHPQLQCTVVDIDAACTATALAHALLAGGTRESQLAVRGGETWCTRLVPLPPAREFRITAPRSGRIEDLVLSPHPVRAPGPGEVRIEVQAAGLNFRDVLCALSMVEGGADSLGGECSGRVVEVGAGVTGFAPGDAVFALAAGGLASSVCVAQQFVAPRPAGLSDASAAALPVACLTASLGLEELAGLRAGDRVLIHAATGGVGLAAVQLARLLGAEVYATAGSPTKREHLRSLGLQHVFDSRSLAFRDQVLASTGGQGVQVVLNALAGDFIAAGLSVVAPGGCFLEMGKRGIWSAEAVAAQYPGLRYHAFDLFDAALHDAALAPRLFARLLARLASGELAPPPVATFPMRDAQSAFQTMAHARHIGKLVLCRDLAAPAAACPIRADASYLVTGGFGALGLGVAEALVARGARHLILLGRGSASADAETRLVRLAAAGVDVRRAHLDVADADALRALLADTGATMPPLRGVVHAAGVLDDGVVEHQAWPRFEAVLRPKLLGALQLAAATTSAALDFLVLFSAGAAWLGAAGQSNYAAANAALDALAQSLRAQGRPATAIAWGRWAGSGMAAARADAGWSAQGIGEIAPHQGMAAMFEFIERNAASVAVLPIDWPTHLAKVHGTRPPACFDALLPRTSPGAVGRPDGLARIQALPAHERREALTARLDALVRQVVAMPAGRSIDPRWPLRELGMDSLMMVELRNAIGTAFDRPLAATVVFDHPTLDALADHLMAVWPGLQEPAEAAPPSDNAADAVRALSEEQAEAELLAELARGADR